MELAHLAIAEKTPLRVDYLVRAGDCPDGERDESNPYEASPRSPQSIEEFGSDDVNVLVAPYASIARGYNIVDSDGHAAVSNLFLCARPLPVPDDLDELSARLSGFAELVASEQPDGEDGDAFDAEEEFRKRMDAARRAFSSSAGGYARMRQVAMREMKSLMSLEQSRPASGDHLHARRFLDVVAGLVAIITQVWGRSARFAQTTEPHPSPIVFFEDYAFIDPSGTPGGPYMSTLDDIDLYLCHVVRDDATGVGRALYGDIYYAWQKSIGEGLIQLTRTAKE